MRSGQIRTLMLYVLVFFYGVILMTKRCNSILEKIAIYMELKGENTFKVSAYRKAAQSLEVDERTLEEIDDVTELKGIGKEKYINEFKTQGQSSTLQTLQDEVPELVPL